MTRKAPSVVRWWLPPKGSLPLIFCWNNRAVAGDLGLEVAEAVPLFAGVEIDFGHDDGSPVPGPGERAAVVVVDGRQHPVARDVFIRAAHQIHMVLAGSG